MEAVVLDQDPGDGDSSRPVLSAVSLLSGRYPHRHRGRSDSFPASSQAGHCCAGGFMMEMPPAGVEHRSTAGAPRRRRRSRGTLTTNGQFDCGRIPSLP